MKFLDFVGLMLLALGIVGLFAGIGAIARNYSAGWAVLICGIGLALASYRLLRSKEETAQ